jgi:hypothetical protein
MNEVIKIAKLSNFPELHSNITQKEGTRLTTEWLDNIPIINKKR